jgi:chromosome segregation ATPase
MDLLRTFMSIITSVKTLVEYAQNLGTDKAKLSQELASTQQQLAAALANDKADAETIAAATAKYDELQAAANAQADKAMQLETTIAGLVKDDAQAEALIAAILPQVEVAPDKVESPTAPNV